MKKITLSITCVAIGAVIVYTMAMGQFRLWRNCYFKSSDIIEIRLDEITIKTNRWYYFSKGDGNQCVVLKNGNMRNEDILISGHDYSTRIIGVDHAGNECDIAVIDWRATGPNGYSMTSIKRALPRQSAQQFDAPKPATNVDSASRELSASPNGAH